MWSQRSTTISHPAALKFLIDSMNQEWHAKPVAFVPDGGVSGGLRAVEHLRQVFAKLHAVTIRDTVSFAQAWGQFDEGGRLRQPEKARRSFVGVVAAPGVVATALNQARAAMPYTREIAG